MKIGLIDMDGHNYPSLPLMKLSAYHKQKGDSVEWYQPLLSGHCDIVYRSKVFSDGVIKKKEEPFEYFVDADQIIDGGSGFCISLENGKEVYKKIDKDLPYEIEHIYPDYSLYPELTKDRCFGFLTRGCPRGCFFCHVKSKEGTVSRKVADLDEFWRGQKNIELLDPNILACKDRFDLLDQLVKSRSKVEFNQGLDARLCTDDVIEALNDIKLVNPHFAFDRYEDKDIVVPKLEKVSEKLNVRNRSINVYILTNYDTTIDQDLERVMIIRRLGMSPYIMRYNKNSIKRGDIKNKLARWVNNRALFWSIDTFDEYLRVEPR